MPLFLLVVHFLHHISLRILGLLNLVPLLSVTVKRDVEDGHLPKKARSLIQHFSVSTLAALTLDLHIHRLDASKGKHYRLDDLDNVDSKHRSSSAAAPYPLERDDNSNNSRYTDHTSSHPRQPLPSLHVSTYDSDNDGQDDNKHGRRSEAFEVPEHGYGAQSVSAGATRYNRSGYAIPEGQFAYDDVEDTGYHGPGAHEGGVLYGGR